jgi:type VI secretion system VasD/TssJ family lipoprotein
MAAYTKLRILSTTPPPARAAARPALVLLVAALALACLQGCGGGSAQPPRPSAESEDPGNVLWSFAGKAVRLELDASKDLNAYEDRAHSLLICVYQLDKRDAFDPLAGTQDGLETLLQCAPFDKSVKSSVRIFLQPGENAVHTLDRAEGAQFVGIVCGFYESTPAQSVRLLQIQPKKTESGHLFWKSTIYSAGTLDLSLHLGANAVAENDTGKPGSEGKAPEEKKADAKGVSMPSAPSAPSAPSTSPTLPPSPPNPAVPGGTGSKGTNHGNADGKGRVRGLPAGGGEMMTRLLSCGSGCIRGAGNT